MTIESPFYRVSVKALVFDAERRLLVVQERNGLWEVPGGGWEHGETLEECVRREVDEELGAHVRTIDRSQIVPCAGRGHRYHRIQLALRVQLEDGELIPGDGMQATRYVTREEFAELPVGNGDESLQADADLLWQLA